MDNTLRAISAILYNGNRVAPIKKQRKENSKNYGYNRIPQKNNNVLRNYAQSRCVSRNPHDD